MNLKYLSDATLEQNLIEYARQERQALSFVILHIKEVSSRRLYLKRGFPSLFEYLVRELKYSNGAAQRRIEAARLIQEIPDVAVKIQEGSLHLSNIGELSRAVKQKEQESGILVSAEQKASLLTEIENKTVGETQQILSERLDLDLRPAERRLVQKDESVHLQITLSKKQYEKLIQCRNLASHALMKTGDASIAAAIERLCDRYLGAFADNNEQASKSSKDAEKTVDESASEKSFTSAAEVTPKNKTITSKMRHSMLKRYKHCQYINPETGNRCLSRFLLEVDHKIPRWAGGSNAEENLTVLCAGHNQAKYRHESGRT